VFALFFMRRDMGIVAVGLIISSTLPFVIKWFGKDQIIGGLHMHMHEAVGKLGVMVIGGIILGIILHLLVLFLKKKKGPG
jgi:uncharacterized membrane protein